MESSIKKIQLLFCKTCGLQRVCDVTEELQKLVTGKYLEPNTCGICQKQVKPNNDNETEKSEQADTKVEQSDDSNDYNDDYGQSDDSYGHNEDYDLLPNLRVVVKKEKIDTNMLIKVPIKRASKTAKVARQEQHVNDVSQESTRVTRLRTGAITTRKYTNPQDDEFSTEDEESDSESNSEDTDNEVQDEEDTAMESEPDEDIDEETQKLMHMEEDPELVASSTLLEDTDENLVRFLDPELIELTLPSDIPERPTKCKVCNATFITIGSFVKHASDHTDKGPMEKPLKCSDCGKNYSTKAFKKHRRGHLKTKTPQQCIYKGCKFVFMERKVFQSHLDVHKGDKRHCCKVCGAGYLRKRDMSEHERDHHRQKRQFLCRYCKEHFSSKFRAKRHERRIHEHQENIQCDECGLTCFSQYMLKRHKESHKTELKTDFVCSKCRNCFADQATLDQHADLNMCKAPADIDWEEATKFVDPRLVALMDKPRIKNKPFRCKQCPTKEYNAASTFLNHMKYKHPQIDCPVTHAYTCDQCDAKFKNPNNIARHNMAHSLHRPYMCDHDGCNKGFKCPRQLKQHKDIHRGDDRRTFICHICGAGLLTNSQLRYHIEAVHFKSKPRPYKCTYCDKSFLHKGEKRYHEKLRHLNERPFVCEVCGKSFKENNELVKHNYTHTGERPYACHLCKYRCRRADYLSKHIRIHTGEHPYRCELCERTFMHKTNLNNHVKKVHSTCKSEPKETLAPSDETASATLNIPAPSTSDVTADGPSNDPPIETKQEIAYETIMFPLQVMEGMNLQIL
ncbi:uncharacterized protein [Amphiura filiformis]|uniref:uncharacterized protein n=1 Tax=Amphiura filiformis TaxID=82378 RepID=UPI003B21459A